MAQTRDTSTYRPYMREGGRGHGGRRMLPRKLSTLSSEELGIDIQLQPHEMKNEDDSMHCPDKTKEDDSIRNATIGHSSVEDAVAALRLYWHKCIDWERSMGFPLKPPSQVGRAFNATSHRQWSRLQMYLDGCNLPIGMRGLKMKELMQNYNAAQQNDNNVVMTIPSDSFQLMAKAAHGHTSDSTSIDWYPHFQSALQPGYGSKFRGITIMWDGSKFRGIMDKSKHVPGDTYQTKVFRLESSMSSKRALQSKDDASISIEITCDGDSADDVLFDRCCGSNTSIGMVNLEINRQIISLDKVIEILSQNIDDFDNDIISHYIVIRRKSGGTKTHRSLFDKLHLRRPNEGALCLSGLTAGLQKDSWKIARELQRERSVEKVIECELRRREELQYIVVTDDVFLTERLTRSGIVLVLSYRQFEHMF